MKRKIFYTAFLALAAGSFLSSCDSKEEKVEDAKQEVVEAKEELREQQQDLNADYPAFKTEAELKIAENDKKIAELNEKLNKPGKQPFDEIRKKKVENLQEKNAQLKSRLYGYEKERSDWETFKREFNSDMEGLGKSFEDLGKDNAK